MHVFCTICSSHLVKKMPTFNARCPFLFPPMCMVCVCVWWGDMTVISPLTIWPGLVILAMNEILFYPLTTEGINVYQ